MRRVLQTTSISQSLYGIKRRKQRTDESAAHESGSYDHGPLPASDVVKAVGLEISSVSEERTISEKALQGVHHPSTFESHI